MATSRKCGTMPVIPVRDSIVTNQLTHEEINKLYRFFNTGVILTFSVKNDNNENVYIEQKALVTRVTQSVDSETNKPEIELEFSLYPISELPKTYYQITDGVKECIIRFNNNLLYNDCSFKLEI